MADARSIDDEKTEQRARILVGDFGAIGGVGLEAMLDAEELEFETNGSTAGELMERVVDGETEVVVLDRQMPHALATAKQIVAQHAEVRVIVCSLEGTTMSVFPGRGADSYESPLDARRLAAAIKERR